MSREEKLKTLFRALAVSSLAAGTAGCGEDFEEVLCEEGETFSPTLALMESSGADYFESERQVWAEEDVDGLVFSSREKYGEPCAGASDKPACLAAFDALPEEGGIEIVSSGFWGERPGTIHELTRYSYTHGDQAAAITTQEGFDQFLLPIDDAKKAAALIALSKETKDYGTPDCGVPAARFMPEGIVVRVREPAECTEYHVDKEHLLLVRPDGGIEHLEERVLDVIFQGCVVGRMTEGVHVAIHPSKRTVADHLAEMAALEAAAVHAFRRLAAEMRVLGAPGWMVERAEEAAEDEVRHASMVGREARRHGGKLRAVEVGPMPLRPILEIALENAREGMVRETYGALSAYHHAHAASDPRLARLFARLAEDETRHSALSIEFGKFLETKLNPKERELVDRARLKAVDALYMELGTALADEVHDVLGWPRPEAARAMLRGAFPAVWS